MAMNKDSWGDAPGYVVGWPLANVFAYHPIRVAFPQVALSDGLRPNGFAFHPIPEAMPQATVPGGLRPKILSQSCVTPTIHTGGPPTTRSWPELLAVSLARAVWVIEGLRALNWSQPTGVGFG